MVELSALKYLASKNQKDAAILFSQKRNSGAIYLIGYAIEMSLKRKICITLGFTSGFPESKAELNIYANQLAIFNFISRGDPLTQIRQIRNHDLNQLLFYSGAKQSVISNCLREWQIIENWNPEKRYRIQRFTNDKAACFMRAAKLVLKEII